MFRAIAVLLLVSGCDVVFGIDRRVDGGADAPAEPSRCAGTSVFRSEFTDDVDFARRWDRDLDVDTEIGIADGMLAITVDIDGYASARTNRTYDFTGAAAQVRIVDFLPYDHGETYAAIIETTQQNTCYVSVDEEGENPPELLMVCLVAGVEASRRPITYDPVAHRYVRFSHELDAGIVFSTSVDGLPNSWTPRHNFVPPWPLTAIHFALGAGSYQPNTVPTATARFDDFELCGPAT